MFNDSKDYDSTQNNFIIVAEEEPEIEPVPSIKQALRRKQFLKKINPPRVRYMLPRRA